MPPRCHRQTSESDAAKTASKNSTSDKIELIDRRNQGEGTFLGSEIQIFNKFSTSQGELMLPWTNCSTKEGGQANNIAHPIILSRRDRKLGELL